MIEKNCIVCSKSFSVIPAREKTSKFCSNKCRLIILHKKISGKKHFGFKKNFKRIKKCKGCKKVMNWWIEYKKKPISTFDNMKFCSKKCADINGFRYSGKDHPNYREDSRRKNRRGSAARWTNNVLKRDNYTCQNCKKYGEKTILETHHIKSFKEHPELRWVLSNGITLCLDCHHEVHGYKKYKGKVILLIKNKKRSIRVKKKCSFCKDILYLKPSDLILTSGINKGKNKKNFYCNKLCMGKHYKLTRIGKNNPRNINI
mgnify:FL=1|tara:strand:+ start:94 stop:870 length:777 start_codon:yes stop_codon:yes gene_type:complete